MYSALIPIVTKESSVDIGDFGICIDKETPDSVANSMARAMELSEEEMKRMSNLASEYVKSWHSLESFERNMRVALRKFVESR